MAEKTFFFKKKKKKIIKLLVLSFLPIAVKVDLESYQIPWLVSCVTYYFFGAWH